MDVQNGNSTLFLTSNANLDMFSDNCASQFTNVLKETIKLDPNVEFQARLANFHIPNVEYILKSNDFDTSSLIYNIGLFEYDTNREAYFQNPNYARELFRLAPDKNIEGLFEKSSRKSTYDASNPENNTRLDLLGKPYGRLQKEKFMFNLNHSLKLSRAKADKYNRELKILNWFKLFLGKKKYISLYRLGQFNAKPHSGLELRPDGRIYPSERAFEG